MGYSSRGTSILRGFVLSINNPEKIKKRTSGKKTIVRSLFVSFSSLLIRRVPKMASIYFGAYIATTIANNTTWRDWLNEIRSAINSMAVSGRDIVRFSGKRPMRHNNARI